MVHWRCQEGGSIFRFRFVLQGTCQSNSETRERFVLRLSELHIAHIRSIGNFIKSSGLDDLWLHSKIYGPNHIKSILSYKHMKCSVEAHKLTLLVLYQLYLELLIKENQLKFDNPENNAFESLCKRNKVCADQSYVDISELHSDLCRGLNSLDLRKLSVSCYAYT